MRAFSLALLFAFVFAVATTRAHHAFDSEFDRNKPVVLTGTVTKVEWTNPHVWIHLDVRAAEGRVVSWLIQGGPPGVLTVNGWTRETIRPGMAIRVEGYGAKLDAAIVHGIEATRADGRTWCVNVPCRSC